MNNKIKEQLDIKPEPKSSIEKDKWGVHENHCCSEHGCKYGDEDCPVVLGLIKQKYPCEDCDDIQIQDNVKQYTEDEVKSMIQNIYTEFAELPSTMYYPHILKDIIRVEVEQNPRKPIKIFK
jgi:hypothetical protein